MEKEHKNETSVTSLWVSHSMININHRAFDVQYPSDLQTKRDKQKRTGTFLLRGIHLSLETILLKPTSFKDELLSQVENSSIEVVRTGVQFVFFLFVYI